MRQERKRHLLVFVYGTLKRGEINHDLLAPAIQSIERGWVEGILHDVGEFPAMVEGTGQVHSELMRVAADDLPRILPILNRLEGYDPRNESGSLYHRRIVDASCASGRHKRAHAYFCNPAHPDMPPLDCFPVVEGGEWTGMVGLRLAAGSSGLEEYREWVRHFAEHEGSEGPFATRAGPDPDWRSH
jgi:gamma-glutamylcyclotransferase (GGCT)/AIG2-like uncharacterized protein YtfP